MRFLYLLKKTVLPFKTDTPSLLYAAGLQTFLSMKLQGRVLRARKVVRQQRMLRTSCRKFQLPRSVQAVLGLGLLALAVFPFAATDFYIQMLTRMMILAIFAMSLDLLQGVSGLISLGHAAYFGLAGYALAFLMPQNEAVSLWWTLPAAVLASGLAALVIGFFVVRTQGIYFIMVTMAFAQMVFYLFFDNKSLGGTRS